jgi:CheY-like chemotaxis protein
VALVDIGLPGIDGYEIARRVREQIGSNVYLIALTGYGQAEDKRKALDAGFNVHLTKPADFVDLQNVLRQISA